MYFLHDRKKTAIVYNDKEYSYRELINGSKFYASLLNIEKDDRVVIYTENRPEFIYSFFAIWDKKGIAVNIDASYDLEHLEYVLKDSEPKYIFTSEHNYKKVVEAKEKLNSSIEIIKFEDKEIPTDFDLKTEGIEEPDEDKTVVILYTSGTTGEPKGVMLTYGNIMSNMNAIREVKVITEDDRILGILPFHHVLPLTTTLLLPIHFGGFVAIVKELSSEAIKTALAKHKITLVIGVPRIWEMLHKGIMNNINSNGISKKLFKICEKINNSALSKILFKKVHEVFGGNIKLLVSGGAKLDEQITKDFTTLGFKMVEGYGLTETSPIIAFNRPDNIKAGTVGTIIPGVEVKISDDGEILVRGLNVMKGYYKKPEATAEVIDSESWFHTGDLGFFDDKHLTITGRKKEMIVLSNGKNINPADIEIQLQKNSDGVIKEVGVIEHNNHLLAIIYPDFELAKSKGIVSIKEDLKWKILDRYNLNAPKYARILETKLVSQELPKTKLGKLQRFKLKDFMNSSGEDNQKTEKPKSDYVETQEYIKLKEYLQKIHSEAEINPESHLEIDIGMDSLDNVELIAYIETTFGIELSEEDLAQKKIVKELADLIKEKGGEFKEAEIDWQKILNTPSEQEIPKSKLFGEIINFIALKPLFSFYIKLSKSGAEKIPNKPVIFAGNHQSLIDAFAFQQLLNSKLTEKTYYLAISEQFESKIKQWVAANSHVIIIDMNKNIKETLKVAAKVLREGNNIVIFPEGARTRDGELQEFKKSFAILSKELNIPVVVFGIKGAYELMPTGSSGIKSGKMSVDILDIVEPEKLKVEEIVEKTKTIIKNYLK